MIVMDALELAIREKLSDYLEGYISFAGFHDWFVPQGWNIQKRAGASTAELAHQLDLLLAEFGHGDWSEDELKAYFEALLMRPIPGLEIMAGSSTPDAFWAPITVGAPRDLSFVDIELGAASG
jgi:hypothetical protein